MTARFEEGDIVAEDRKQRVARVHVAIGPAPYLYTLTLVNGQRGQAFERHLRPALQLEAAKYRELFAAHAEQQASSLQLYRQHRPEVGRVPEG